MTMLNNQRVLVGFYQGPLQHVDDWASLHQFGGVTALGLNADDAILP